MTRRFSVVGVTSPAFIAMGLGVLSTMACGAGLMTILVGQIVAQRLAVQGVMVVHLSQRGDLRLWNQPIHPQDLPLVLERLRLRRTIHPAVPVVRLVPEREVPWGVVHQMLDRLRPTEARNSWTLQLQLP
jgi:hypothetical protein